MAHNKRNLAQQDSELPIETVLNPGFIVMKEGNWKPVDILVTDSLNTKESTQQA